MDAKTLSGAVRIAQNIGIVHVATADAEGRPHLAVARDVDLSEDGRLLVGEWFCPTTARNVADNPRVSVVVWDAETDSGRQLEGVVEDVEESAVLDGYMPDEPELPITPSVRRVLRVRVERAVPFCHAPHTDQPQQE
jgi:pyridoxine/pyridoxamine 5'-phosphate oxidase